MSGERGGLEACTHRRSRGGSERRGSGCHATCLFAALTGSLLFAVSGASGHAPGAALYGAGTATIDGSLSPGEWDGARRLDFAARVPAHDGGATIPATIRAMNDGTTLYVSLQVGRATYGGSTGFSLYFDNDHDGIREAGDDAFHADVGMFSPAVPRLALDLVRAWRTRSRVSRRRQPRWLERGYVGCGIGGGSVVLEVSHPLNSADDAHDFSLGLEASWVLPLSAYRRGYDVQLRRRLRPHPGADRDP